MKVAVCLYGLSNGRNDRGRAVDTTCLPSVLDKHVKPFDADVFFHTWTEDAAHEAYLVETLRPTKHACEAPRMFAEAKNKKQSTYSRWFTFQRVLELKRQHEQEQGFQYDWVVVCRFDMTFLKGFNLGAYPRDALVTAEFEPPEALDDAWFVGSSPVMDKMAPLFENLDAMLDAGCELSNHSLSYRQAVTQGLRFHVVPQEFINYAEFQRKRGGY